MGSIRGRKFLDQMSKYQILNSYLLFSVSYLRMQLFTAVGVSSFLSEHAYIHLTLQSIIVTRPTSLRTTLTLTLHTVGLYLCISYDSQNKQVLAHLPNNINPIVLVTETHWVSCEVRTEFLNII
jgi:hypothetical protein